MGMKNHGMTLPIKAKKKSKYEHVEKTMTIDTRDAARVAGKDGRKLLNLTKETGAKVILRGNELAAKNTLVFTGMKWQVKKAMKMVKDMTEKKPRHDKDDRSRDRGRDRGRDSRGYDR